MRFFLGTHLVKWLEFAEFPLMVSHRQLKKRKTLPRAVTPWMLDGGGFTELHLFGRYTESHIAYAKAVRRYRGEIGMLEWAAPQDWMCEPMARAKTGYMVRDHQRLTVHNLIDLREFAPELPFFPVLQGWEADDYYRHVDLYAANRIDLAAEPLVGIGSVCRRQSTAEIDRIISGLAGLGLSLHGFGIKTNGLAKYGHYLTSADSLAWSRGARWEPPLSGCVGHKSCANCYRYAKQWRASVLAAAETPQQMAFGLALR